MTENIKAISKVGSGFINGRMDGNTRDSGLTGSSTGRASSRRLRAWRKKDSGKMDNVLAGLITD